MRSEFSVVLPMLTIEKATPGLTDMTLCVHVCTEDRCLGTKRMAFGNLSGILCKTLSVCPSQTLNYSGMQRK